MSLVFSGSSSSRGGRPLTGLFVEFWVTTMSGSPTARRIKLSVTDATTESNTLEVICTQADTELQFCNSAKCSPDQHLHAPHDHERCPRPAIRCDIALHTSEQPVLPSHLFSGVRREGFIKS